MSMLMKYLYTILAFALIPLGCCTLNVEMGGVSKIINGGRKTSLTHFSDEDSSYNQLLPGTVVCFYKDNIVGQEYGPSYSDTSIVIISNEFTTDVSFDGVRQNIEEKDFKSANNELSLSSSTSIDELIERLQASELTLSMDFSYLLDLFLKAKHSTDMSVREFMEELLLNGLISQGEYNRLIELFREKGFSINNSLSELSAFLKSNSLDINLNSKQFVLFLKQYKLERLVNLEMILNSIMVGRPKLILSKKADRRMVWYGGTINYSFEYKNLGNVAAKDIYIIDAIPEGLEYKNVVESSNSIDVNLVCRSNYQIIVFSINDELNAGKTGKIVFSVHVMEKTN